jgi:uncharacterized membrane protein YkoI
MCKYYYLIFIFISAIPQYSCENPQKATTTHPQAVANTNSEAAKYYKEAIAIHDEVMPKMGKMDELKEKLEKILTNPRLKLSNDRLPYETAIKNLEKADDMMMDVMAEMKEPDAAIPADQAIKTMTELSKKANEMRAFTFKTISEAEALVVAKK